VTPFHLGSATKADLPHGGKSRKVSGYTRAKRGGVAQRLERRTHNPQVGGSNPPAAIRFVEPIRKESTRKSAISETGPCCPVRNRSDPFHTLPPGYFQGIAGYWQGTETVGAMRARLCGERKRVDKVEASAILAAEVEKLRARSYSELVARLLDRQETFEVTGPSGSWYYVELQAFWDDESARNLRVLGAIDDGGWRAFAPLTDDFILAPDGSFVGE
jgi:hypothetical protein